MFMNKITKILLLTCILSLFLVCIISAYSPIKFLHEQTFRENEVKEKLILIRNAEKKYIEKNGYYCGSFKEMINMGYLKAQTQYIPYSQGKTFSLSTSSQFLKSGKQIPLMECSAMFSDYLKGLDNNKIKEITEKANSSGKYPGLKFGDITIFNDNAGNWE